MAPVTLPARNPSPMDEAPDATARPATRAATRPTTRRLVRLDALADGSLTRLEHRGAALLLCRVGPDVHAVADRCTHEDVSLSLGSLCGHRLRCPLHGSAFDVRDGAALEEPAEEALATWPVTIEDGWVTIPDEGARSD